MISSVWVFNAAQSSFPSGVFTCMEIAESWIVANQLTGTLTEYPLNQGTYDWAVANHLFKPTKPNHTTPNFIGRFTSASQKHFHYENDTND